MSIAFLLPSTTMSRKHAAGYRTIVPCRAVDVKANLMTREGGDLSPTSYDGIHTAPPLHRRPYRILQSSIFPLKKGNDPCRTLYGPPPRRASAVRYHFVLAPRPCMPSSKSYLICCAVLAVIGTTTQTRRRKPGRNNEYYRNSHHSIHFHQALASRQATTQRITAAGERQKHRQPSRLELHLVHQLTQPSLQRG